MSYVPVCVNSLGCGITGQHTVECLERMVSGLWEEQLRMQPVIEAAKALVHSGEFGPEDFWAEEERRLDEAVRTLEEPACPCDNIVFAPGSDFDGMKVHDYECPWLRWFRSYGEED